MSVLGSLLNDRQLVKLKEHKYSAINYSFLDKYLNPFWTWLELKTPVSIHPNTMTLAGLAVNWITTLFLIYYSPEAKTPSPAWTHLICSVGIFIYQTLDAMDGKHARRTNTSSPLGELFDHGCDALSTLFVMSGICVALQLGKEPLWLCFFMFSAVVVFYLAHWQTYVTGSLQFQVFDVTEIQYVCMALHIVTAFGGAEFWDIELPVVQMKFRGVAYWIMAVGAVMNVWNKASIILKGGPGRNGSAVGDMSIVAPGLPLALVLWLSYYIFENYHEVEANMLVYLFALNIVLSKITCRLVVAHMTQSEMRFWDSAYIIPLIMIARHYWNLSKFIPESAWLWICLVHVSVDLLIYCVRACIEISSYLGIMVFSMHPVQFAPGYLKAGDPVSRGKKTVPRLNTARDPVRQSGSQPGSPRIRQ